MAEEKGDPVRQPVSTSQSARLLSSELDLSSQKTTFVVRKGQGHRYQRLNLTGVCSGGQGQWFVSRMSHFKESWGTMSCFLQFLTFSLTCHFNNEVKR